MPGPHVSQVRLPQLVRELVALSLDGAAGKIAQLMSEIAPHFNELGRPDLGGRLTRIAVALDQDIYLRQDWVRSDLYEELERIHGSLEQGDPVEEAVKARDFSEKLERMIGPTGPRPKPIIARRLREAVASFPEIPWEKFGSENHPAPDAPDEHVDTAGKKLNRFASFVASFTASRAAGDNKGEIDDAHREKTLENFYGISSGTRVRMREGFFVPNALGQFPSDDARKLIDKAASVEPRYGELMHTLMIYSIFEAQEWAYLSEENAPWDLSFLFSLRLYFADQLLAEEGKKRVMGDETLVRVVKKDIKLDFENVKWHPGRTRREVFEPWLDAAFEGNPEGLKKQRRMIGEAFLAKWGWEKPPKEDRREIVKLQWLLRYWIAHYHYGILPARGLPLPSEKIREIAHAKLVNPVVNPKLKKILSDMMKDFYSPEELQSLSVKEG